MAKGKFRYVLIFLFMAMLSLPLLLWATGRAPTPVNILENRKPATEPSYSSLPWRQWPAATDRWLGDNIPLRTQAISSYMNIWEWQLHTPVRYALRGRNGHLFAKQLVEKHSGILLPSSELLFRYRALYVGRSGWFSQKVIAYTAIFAADKESVLIDFLPDWVSSARKTNPLPRLSALLQKASVPHIVMGDVIATSNKPKTTFYNFKHDIWHWNVNGLMAADDQLRHFLEKSTNKKLLTNDIKPTPSVGERSVGPYGIEKVPQFGFSAPTLTIQKGEPWPLVLSEPRIISIFPTLITNANTDSIRLAVAADSYFNWTGGVALPNANSQVLPLVLQTSSTLWFDLEDFSYASMQRIANEFRPHAVIEEFCERDLWAMGPRTYHPEVMLLGEKYLNNLKLALIPQVFSDVRVSNARLSTFQDAAKIVAITSAPQIDFLYNIATNAEGYAVVAGRLQAPADTEACIKYRAQGGQWKNLTQKIVKGENILYFQIIEAPNALIEIKFLPGMAQGEYTLLPMPFLNDVTDTRNS